MPSNNCACYSANSQPQEQEYNKLDTFLFQSPDVCVDELADDALVATVTSRANSSSGDGPDDLVHAPLAEHQDIIADARDIDDEVVVQERQGILDRGYLAAQNAAEELLGWRAQRGVAEDFVNCILYVLVERCECRIQLSGSPVDPPEQVVINRALGHIDARVDIISVSLRMCHHGGVDVGGDGGGEIADRGRNLVRVLRLERPGSQELDFDGEDTQDPYHQADHGRLVENVCSKPAERVGSFA